MFKAIRYRILVFANANPSHSASSLCERIGDDMPSTFLLCMAGQGSQYYVDFIKLVYIYVSVSKYEHWNDFWRKKYI
jgi:hypothetical protein